MTISTQAFLAINVGTSANDGTGDSLRAAFVKINTNFSNISSIGFDTGNVNVQGSLLLANVYVPMLANSTGTAGQVAWDNSHVYICIATNSWVRANTAAW